MSDLPPAIGPYRPLDRLGSGGMGEVFLTRDGTGVMLALKVVRSDLTAREDLRARLAREVEIMRLIRGKNIAELVDADLTADTPYLATRYVQGRSLAEVVEEDGPLDGPVLRGLARGLAQALQVIHETGCLHRDLKPSNVIMDGGEPVVIDFGISHALDDTRFTRHGRASGSPGYMAPELLSDGRAGVPSDVFSWGGTVAYAATGRNAYWAQLSPASLRELITSAPDLPPSLAGCLFQALNPDPAARPTPQVLLERLAALKPRRGADRSLDVPLTSQAARAGTVVPVFLSDGEVLQIPVPAGTGHGNRITFSGRGDPGLSGGLPGDLHLKISVLPDPVPAETDTRTFRHWSNPDVVQPAMAAMALVAGLLFLTLWREERPLDKVEASASATTGPTNAAEAPLKVDFGLMSCPSGMATVLVTNTSDDFQRYSITLNESTVTSDRLDPADSRGSTATITKNSPAVIRVIQHGRTLSKHTYRNNCSE